VAGGNICHTTSLITEQKINLIIKTTFIGNTMLFFQKYSEYAEILQDESANPNININLIADRLNISRRWFYNQIVRETGKTPSEYLEEVRLQKSLCLLGAGESLALVSGKVGYANTKTFSEAFKRRYGVSPGKWGKDTPPQQSSQLVEITGEFPKRHPIFGVARSFVLWYFCSEIYFSLVFIGCWSGYSRLLSCMWRISEKQQMAGKNFGKDCFKITMFFCLIWSSL